MTPERLLIRENESVGPIVEQLEKVPTVGLDLETTGLDPNENKLRLYSVHSPDLKKTFIFDLFYVRNFDPIRQFTLNPKVAKIGHNLIFDTKFCLKTLNAYIETPLDTLLASQLLQLVNLSDPSQRASNKLSDVARRELGVELDKSLQTSDWSRELSREQLTYAALDTEVLPPVIDKLSSRLIKEEMEEAFVTECSFIFPCAQMELYGIKISSNRVGDLKSELDEKIEKAKTIIAEYLPSKQPNLFGTPETINLNSSQQVASAIKEHFGLVPMAFDKESQQNKISVASDTLWLYVYDERKVKRLPKEFVQALTEYQTLSKAKSSTLNNLIKYRKPNGRVYPEWRQLGQPQHRVSAQQPNMLSVPRPDNFGPKVETPNSLLKSELSFRSIFVPEDGYKFVISDASQLQYRIIAQLSQEPNLLRMYLEGADQHAETGAMLYEVDLDKVSVAHRQTGKTANFALVFAAGPETLQNGMLATHGLYKTLEQWGEFRDKYYRKNKVFSNWQKKNINLAKEKRIIRAGGRTVFLAPQSAYYVQAVNFPAVLMEQQIVKRAAGIITRKCWGRYNTHQVLNIYDELVYETVERDSEAVKEIVQTEFVASLSKYITTIPVKADAHVCLDWGEK